MSGTIKRKYQVRLGHMFDGRLREPLKWARGLARINEFRESSGIAEDLALVNAITGERFSPPASAHLHTHMQCVLLGGEYCIARGPQ